MKTNSFESVKSEVSINKCLEYSENKEKLQALLDNLDVQVLFTGIRKHFPDDKEERLTGIFKLIINKGYDPNTERTESFAFGFSLKDTVLALFPDNLWNIKNLLDDYKFRKQIHAIIKEDWVNRKPSGIMKDKRNFKDDLLYTCLASCKSDYSIPIDFDDFCSEFGYSNDSIKTKDTWERCLKQSSKLHRIFDDSEIDCLPS